MVFLVQIMLAASGFYASFGVERQGQLLLLRADPSSYKLP
jgi:hypothetical protein